MKPPMWIVVAVMVVCRVPAWADLCDACKDKVYVTAIGKCAVCGGQTPSKGLKLCEKCSKKLDQCEACRKTLKKAATQPAATQPATQSAT